MVVAALLAGDLSAASPKERLRAKQAQAKAVLGQVNQLNQSFEASVEAWNGARYELDVTKRQLVVDRRRLRTAERLRRVAMAHVAERLRALYETGDDDQSTLSIVLGSTSVSEILDRLDAARAVAAADKKLTEQATAARNRYAQAARTAAATVRRRTVAFGQQDRERRRIGTLLDERKRLLAGVQSEVVKLQAEEAAAEAAQQARLRAAARARLAAEARERKEQAEAAAAAARIKAATVPTTTTAAAPTTTAAAPPPPTIAPVTTTTAPPAVPAVPAGPGHPEAATIALHYLGIPYLWGGASPATGFDCSGLVMYVYAQIGISLPHYAAAQYQLGAPVGRDQLQPGDLVFFDALDHVGIYIGGGQFVHAPQTGDVVKITPLQDFGSSYVGARRL
ncbi:MAG TPA: NlpC/P60 family protein [Gaiellaceae bacterium]|nr:NlpC/P60 family protein [Gaiellaceae bacterium]